jgi:hypothetical protein
MRHIRLIVLGIVLVCVVVFGFLFWDDLKFNQEQISNTPLPPSPEVSDDGRLMNPELQQGAGANMNQSDSYDDMESDLDGTDVDDLDPDSSELDAEINAL